MRRLCLLAVLCLLLGGRSLGEPNRRVGFYQWVGEPPSGSHQDLLTLARERVKSTGAGLLRFYVGARFDYIHPLLSPRRFEQLEERTPARIVDLPRYRAVLEDPALPTLVLTVYPSMDYGAGHDDISLLRPWSSREEKQEYRQMFDLATHLLEKYGALEKTIILANTEADDKLLEIMNYTGSPRMAIENLRAWQNTRFRAVERARRLYPKTRLRLLVAFEISLVNLKIFRRRDRFVKHPQGQWNALRDVVPKVRFDLLSYSSYESTNSPYETGIIDTPASKVGARLLREINFLRKAVSTPVMIGELGIPWDLFDRLPTGGVPARLSSALKALETANPAFVIFWQVFDAPFEGREPTGFGWLDPRRSTEPILLRFISSFGNRPKGRQDVNEARGPRRHPLGSFPGCSTSRDLKDIAGCPFYVLTPVRRVLSRQP